MKILILGVGSAQVDAIKYCKSKGYTVYAVSYLPEGEGLKYVDFFEQINITDKEAVLEYATKIKADVVYTVGSDIAMPTVGYVCEKLNLPHFIKEKTATVLNSKNILRYFLYKHGFPYIRFKSGKTFEEISNWRIFPAIIKPVDSQGQRGVFKVYDIDEVKKYFNRSLSFSRSGRVIIEEYIPGYEISANAFVVNGRVKYSFISDRRVFENTVFSVVRGHHLPAKVNSWVKRRANNLICEAVKRLKIQDGPLYFQMKYTDTEVFIIEIAGRLDGCHIWKLIDLKYGVNLLQLSFDMLTDGPHKINFPSGKANLSDELSLNFYLLPPNTEYVDEKLDCENSIYSRYYYKRGDTVRPINGFLEKAGFQIIKVPAEVKYSEYVLSSYFNF